MPLKKCVFIFLLSAPVFLYAQPLSNARQKYIPVKQDSISIDTLSIIPGTFFITGVDSSFYDFNFAKATLSWKKDNPAYQSLPDSVLAVYRVFPVLFTKGVTHREKSIIEKNYSGIYNPYQYNETNKDKDVFKIEGLSKNGSISRGVSFGNNQDVIVNSSLNLQLAGRLNDDVEILAAITDNNIPVQPDGNTQQLNEFDKVFIQLSKNKSKLIAGDFDLTRPESYFLNFNKKSQGAVFSSEFSLTEDKTKKPLMRLTASGAVSKGKFARNIFNGSEGNQGPYKLRGADNESFIVILSGSEKIFIDGMLLTRGQEFDYVIDYNTAEITFTTKRLITKDKRIVAEFQYSDKNYSRSLVFFNDEYETEKLKLKLNVYSEQDSKNQPLLQDLSNEQKEFLSTIGDSISLALDTNVQTVPFNVNEILYEKIDSAGFVFYRYSTDSAVAHYRLGFANLGAGNGNYIQATTSANGRVFTWVPPLNGIPQGSYEPVSLLITPRQQQMVTFGADYKISENSKVIFEGAMSNYNVNLFSKKDKADNTGFAATTGFNRIFHLDKEKTGWKMNTGFKFEHINKNFVQVENFRNTEFTRDWNLTGLNVREDENAGSILLGFSKSSNYLINYQLKSFLKGKQYNGYLNSLGGFLTHKTAKLVFDGSYLTSSGSLTKTTFLRSASDLSNTFFKRLITGVRFNQERNSLFFPATDSLMPSAFANHTSVFYVTNADTAKIRYKADISRRYDYAVKYNIFFNSTIADDVTGALEFNMKNSSRLAITTTYRKLQITDTLLSSLETDNNLLNRIEYNASFLKGAVVTTTFFEVGSGQELKREYAYVLVADGTGVFAWNDYNNDGIQQLDEFETALFQDQANYLRVFIPTNEFVRTRFNQLNQVLSFNPAAVSKREKKGGKMLSRFSNQFSMRLDNKTTESNLLQSLNPFENNVKDSLLISTNSSYRNTFFFNRISTVFATDITYENNRNKLLLTNGFETRLIKEWNGNVRYNFSRAFGIGQFGEAGDKQNRSEYFSARDFLIKYYSSETRFNFQPGTRWRITLLYEYKYKKNTISDLGEKSIQQKGGVELRLSSVKRGIISARFNMVNIDFNAEENSSLAYEMLEGLKKGTNYTWNLSIQRNLSGNVQLSLNYDGRKPESVRPIHTGSVEVRAYF